MKTTVTILIATAFLLASCSRGFYATSTEYDDVYYTPGTKTQTLTSTEQVVTLDSPVNNEALRPERIEGTSAAQYNVEPLSDYERYKLEKEMEMLGESNESYAPEGEYFQDDSYSNEQASYGYYDDDQDRIVINNYYSGSSYNDYDHYYSSRFRRFHRPSYRWNYYDPYYSDMYYYNYNPAYWGVSIYSGFGYNPWYYGGYYPSYGMGWYDPWYYGSYRGSYWTGYRSGFYDGYYGYGYSPYYYSSYSSNRWSYTHNRDDYYYGHRSSRSGYSPFNSSATGSAVRKSTTTTSDPRIRSRSVSPVNEGARKAGTSGTAVDPAVRTRNLDGTTGGAVRPATRDAGPTGGAVRPTTRDAGPTGVQKSTPGTERTRTETVRPGTNVRSTTPSGTVERPVYRQPASANENQRSTPPNQEGIRRDGVGSSSGNNTYTPNYTRPRTTSTPIYNRGENSGSSSGETRKGSDVARPVVTAPANTRPSTTTTRPATSRPTVTPPTRSSGGSYNSPGNVSRPSSTPSRSSPSYSRPSSTPSRSSPSYSRPSSTPSRSSPSYSSPSSSPSRSSGSSVSSGSSGSSSRSSGSSSSSSSSSGRSSSSGSGRR